MPLHLAPLMYGQRSRFQKDRIGKTDLTYVVQRSCDVKLLRSSFIHTEAVGDDARHERHPNNVISRLVVPPLGGTRHALNDFDFPRSDCLDRADYPRFETSRSAAVAGFALRAGAEDS